MIGTKVEIGKFRLYDPDQTEHLNVHHLASYINYVFY